MQKLKIQLRYARDIAVDYIVRNIDEKGVLPGADLLTQAYCVLAVLEDGKRKSETVSALQHLASHGYHKKDTIYLLNEQFQNDEELDSVAGLCFLLSEKRIWATGLARGLTHSSLPQTAYFYLKLFELDYGKNWLDAAVSICKTITEEGALDDYWNMIVLNSCYQITKEEKLLQWITESRAREGRNLDISANALPTLGTDDMNEITEQCKRRLSQQIQPSHPVLAGGFGEQKVDLKLFYPYLRSFSKVLSCIRQTPVV